MKNILLQEMVALSNLESGFLGDFKNSWIVEHLEELLDARKYYASILKHEPESHRHAY